MPATARLPSGTLVEVLCGQPEQKNGVRAIAGWWPPPRAPSRRGTRGARRCAARGTEALEPAGDDPRDLVAVSSLVSRSSGAPCSSDLPMITGAGRGQL